MLSHPEGSINGPASGQAQQHDLTSPTNSVMGDNSQAEGMIPVSIFLYPHPPYLEVELEVGSTPADLEAEMTDTWTETEMGTVWAGYEQGLPEPRPCQSCQEVSRRYFPR